MENKIIYYKKNGNFDHDELLNIENLAHTNGMMIKCHLKDGSEKVGYSDPYRLKENNNILEVNDYIYLVTWDNLDEETHKLTGDYESMYDRTYTPISIDDIISVEAILYSNPRWGGTLTNLFSFTK